MRGPAGPCPLGGGAERSACGATRTEPAATHPEASARANAAPANGRVKRICQDAVRSAGGEPKHKTVGRFASGAPLPVGSRKRSAGGSPAHDGPQPGRIAPPGAAARLAEEIRDAGAQIGGAGDPAIHLQECVDHARLAMGGDRDAGFAEARGKTLALVA